MPSHPEVVEAFLAAQLAPLSRRAFLTGTLAGTALGLTACTPGTPQPAGIKNLTGDEHALFDKLLPLFLPTEGTGIIAPTEVPTLANVDALFGRLQGDMRRNLGIGLRLFDWGALVVGWHFKRFVALDAEPARAYCSRWESGNTIQRGVFGALKQIIYVSYWREPATWPPIGYEGPVTVRYGLPRLGNAPLPTE